MQENLDYLIQRQDYIENDIKLQNMKAQHKKVIEEVERGGEIFSKHVLHMMHNREELIRLARSKDFLVNILPKLKNHQEREKD
mgnify:CR=1 FL=1